MYTTYPILDDVLDTVLITQWSFFTDNLGAVPEVEGSAIVSTYLLPEP
jgi:hypothetical protein